MYIKCLEYVYFLIKNLIRMKPIIWYPSSNTSTRNNFNRKLWKVRSRKVTYTSDMFVQYWKWYDCCNINMRDSTGQYFWKRMKQNINKLFIHWPRLLKAKNLNVTYFQTILRDNIINSKRIYNKLLLKNSQLHRTKNGIDIWFVLWHINNIAFAPNSCLSLRHRVLP